MNDPAAVAPDPVDAAISAAEAPTTGTHASLNIKLPGDREALIVVPLGMNPVDVFLLTDVLHQHLREQPVPAVVRAGLVLP